MTSDSPSLIERDLKTMTRRVIKPQPIVSAIDPDRLLDWKDGSMDRTMMCNHCPYGQVGDHLWVKEAWTPFTKSTWSFDEECYVETYHVRYADGTEVPVSDEAAFLGWELKHVKKRGPQLLTKQNPRFMPRWASRLTLEITEVKVERLNAISTFDAEGEGVGFEIQKHYGDCRRDGETQNQAIFRELWESINGKGSWDINPWVWAISFKVVPNA
jgi:hypothetical protein